eukprot:SAG22_NODE_3970_length_1445_cov_1.451709_1_plen_146_part_10
MATTTTTTTPALIGTEVLTISAAPDGNGGGVPEFKVVQKGVVEQVTTAAAAFDHDAVTFDGSFGEVGAFACAGEGAVALSEPLELVGDEFSVSAWFKTPLPPIEQLAMVVSGGKERQTPRGPQVVVAGVAFMKDSLGVMIMGKFSP